MCFITLLFFLLFLPYSLPFFMKSFKFFPVFQFRQKFPPPRGGGGNGQNIYPCTQALASIKLAWILFYFNHTKYALYGFCSLWCSLDSSLLPVDNKGEKRTEYNEFKVFGELIFPFQEFDYLCTNFFFNSEQKSYERICEKFYGFWVVSEFFPTYWEKIRKKGEKLRRLCEENFWYLK